MGARSLSTNHAGASRGLRSTSRTGRLTKRGRGQCPPCMALARGVEWSGDRVVTDESSVGRAPPRSRRVVFVSVRHRMLPRYLLPLTHSACTAGSLRVTSTYCHDNHHDPRFLQLFHGTRFQEPDTNRPDFCIYNFCTIHSRIYKS